MAAVAVMTPSSSPVSDSTTARDRSLDRWDGPQPSRKTPTSTLNRLTWRCRLAGSTASTWWWSQRPTVPSARVGRRTRRGDNYHYRRQPGEGWKRPRPTRKNRICFDVAQAASIQACYIQASRRWTTPAQAPIKVVTLDRHPRVATSTGGADECAHAGASSGFPASGGIVHDATRRLGPDAGATHSDASAYPPLRSPRNRMIPGNTRFLLTLGDLRCGFDGGGQGTERMCGPDDPVRGAGRQPGQKPWPPQQQEVFPAEPLGLTAHECRPVAEQIDVAEMLTPLRADADVGLHRSGRQTRQVAVDPTRHDITAPNRRSASAAIGPWFARKPSNSGPVPLSLSKASSSTCSRGW